MIYREKEKNRLCFCVGDKKKNFLMKEAIRLRKNVSQLIRDIIDDYMIKRTKKEEEKSE